MSTKSYHFYRRILLVLTQAKIPFLVGGSYALAHYTGIRRDTKDLDVFVHERDFKTIAHTFSQEGLSVELTFPHWLGKIYEEKEFVDIIFNSGNGIARVDEYWFEHRTEGKLFEIPVQFCPAEEMIWAKAYIMERERYDGADVAHLIRACSAELNWQHLIERFDTHWHILLGHLILFTFIYPSHRSLIPQWVFETLLERLRNDLTSGPIPDRLCQGTLLSRAQYLTDIDEWHYEDARLIPRGNMTPEDTTLWTKAIAQETCAGLTCMKHS